MRSRFWSMKARGVSGMAIPPDLSVHRPATVDAEHLAGTPAGVVGGEEQDAVGDVLGGTGTLEGRALDQRLLALRPVRLPLAFGGRIAAHEARSDVVDGDPPRAQLLGKLPRQSDLPCLGARVGLNPRQAGAPARSGRDVHNPA